MTSWRVLVGGTGLVVVWTIFATTSDSDLVQTASLFFIVTTIGMMIVRLKRRRERRSTSRWR